MRNLKVAATWFLRKSMYKEELTEEGIVKQSKDGIAEIIISESNHCEECSAKIYCKTVNENIRTLIAKDPFNSNAGDRVVIAISGSRLLIASLQLYGFPLIIILTSIVLGMNLFNYNREFYSTVLGIVSCGIYLFIFSTLAKKNKEKFFPVITRVKKLPKNF